MYLNFQTSFKSHCHHYCTLYRPWERGGCVTCPSPPALTSCKQPKGPLYSIRFLTPSLSERILWFRWCEGLPSEVIIILMKFFRLLAIPFKKWWQISLLPSRRRHFAPSLFLKDLKLGFMKLILSWLSPNY